MLRIACWAWIEDDLLYISALILPSGCMSARRKSRFRLNASDKQFSFTSASIAVGQFGLGCKCVTKGSQPYNQEEYQTSRANRQLRMCNVDKCLTLQQALTRGDHTKMPTALEDVVLPFHNLDVGFRDRVSCGQVLPHPSTLVEQPSLIFEPQEENAASMPELPPTGSRDLTATSANFAAMITVLTELFRGAYTPCGLATQSELVR